MKKRVNISSGTKWENIIGYSRAVKVGNVIEVAGTTATEGDVIVAPKDFYKQTEYIIQKIEAALKQAGSSLNDVVRTRIFVTDISKWEDVGKAHGAFFGKIKPAATMVEVKALIHPDLVVEIEATAVISQ